ncbi:MAG TPA: polysaccharide biosynthesis tyrosine autokinase [Bryobacteraceae bacterium]|jgi:capsular exopolysaccharide synthesis family protein|nr:polysaccharide biosynthesis tyrosine autokinase [Bryobacteraceae bacterium]
MKHPDRLVPELASTRRMPQPLPLPPYLEIDPPQASLPASHYLFLILRHKWKILGFVGVCLLATYLVCARLTPLYEATAKIDVDRRVPIGIIGQEASQASSGDDADAFMATQMELIQADAVVRPVAEKFNLLQRESQLEKLAKDKVRRKTDAPVYLRQLKVTRPVNTYILRISYRSPDPQLAADVANAVAQSYLEHTFEIRIRSSSALSAFMVKQLDELKAKMERSSLALAKFERELNVLNPEEKTNILAARLLQLNTEYTSAQADRVRKEAAHNAMQSGSLAAAEISTQGDSLKQLQDRVNQAKQHLADVASIYGPNHSEYRKASNDLAELQRQFSEMQHSVAQRVEADYTEAVNREKMLATAVARTKAEYDQLNGRSFEYQQLKRDADADKALYSDLERRIREAGINAGFQNSSIRIADFARPPDAPVYPRKKLSLLLAFIISSVIAICGAILSDVLDDTVRDPEQAARALDTAVLGTLPAVKQMKRLRNSVAQNGMPPNLLPNGHTPRGLLGLTKAEDGSPPRLLLPGSSVYEGIASYEESIRTLRQSILLPDFERNLKSLLITSAAPGEGKSTSVIHLAIAHAEQGKRTLIIDADLRRPSVHKKINLEMRTGLSNVLLGEMTWKQALVNTKTWPDLDVLPAGMASRRASDLVGSMMIDILDEAAKEYDLILVDAPPVLGFAEAMQIASAVDGVIVIARAGQTSRKAVGTALATLRRLQTNVIGLVLNEVDKHSTNGYYYYSEYRKYYAEDRPENA